ncbi:MAG: 2,3-bisphosphoglycerate-independent phosphoglycerate mutase [Polyangiales bacterium]
MPSRENKLGGPVVLVILDGFGERPPAADNAITRAKMPRYAALRAKYPHTTIGTSGPDVGLPDGQMGNSEVGHLNFGAGRVAQMDISRIDCAVADRTFMNNPHIARTIGAVKSSSGRLHLLGLVSDGGVHSSIEHLLALIDGATAQGVPVVVHAFLDGRDTPPKSAGNYLERVHSHLMRAPTQGIIGTIAGRYFAMDRDKRWDRVERAYRAIVHAEGRTGGGDDPHFHNAMAALADAYALGQTDEFVEPRIVSGYQGARSGDAAIFFNFRPDRARELTEALNANEFSGFDRKGTDPASIGKEWTQPFAPWVCMTEYDARLGLDVAFSKPAYHDTFPEVVARAGMRQLRCAETEKYAHVTYFFNGGSEVSFAHEDRILVPSPRDVATYDKKPEMSAPAVSASVCQGIREQDYDFVLVNFANADMVGHTGVLGAAIAAVEALDVAIGEVVDATLAKNGAVIITADHGNCEQMLDEKTGAPFTQHTLNRVPLLLVLPDASAYSLRDGGRIADVAPSMLQLLGLAIPAAMTGTSLLIDR